MQRRLTTRSTILAVLVLVSALTWAPSSEARAQQDAPATILPTTKRFEPTQHLPADLLLLARVASVDRLRASLSQTTIGQIVLHPAWNDALAGVRQRLAAPLARLGEQSLALTGKRPQELLALLQGEIVFAITGPGAAGLPQAVLAIEMGPDRDGLLELTERLATHLADATGVEEGTQEETVAGYAVTSLPTPVGKLVYGALGTHLVVATSPDTFGQLAVAFDGNTTGLNLFPSSRLFSALEKAHTEGGAEIEAAVDVARLRLLALGAFGHGDTQEMATKVLEITGLDRVGTASIQCAIPEGEIDLGAHVSFDGAPHGLLALVSESLPPLELADGAIGHVPLDSTELAAVRVAPGKLLEGVVALARQHFPEAEKDVNEWLRSIEELSGISVERDLFSLPTLTITSSRVAPPGGSLFEDQLVVARTEEITPYRTLVEKIAALLEAPIRRLEIGDHSIHYVALAHAGKGASRLFDLVESEDPSALAMVPPAAWVSLFLPTLYWCDLPDGWTVLALSSQALQRYIRYYAPWTSFTPETQFARLFRERANGASFASVFKGSNRLVWLYNTALEIANAFGPTLAGVGIDLGPLPPGEEFRRESPPGFLRLEASAEGFALRARRPFASFGTAAWLVGGGAVAAAVAIPVWTGTSTSVPLAPSEE